MRGNHQERIHRLTSEQEQRLTLWRDEWFRLGTATEPVDRARVECAISAMYAELKRPPPRYDWVTSPVAMLAVALARSVESDPMQRPEEALRDTLGGTLGPTLWVEMRASLDRTLRATLDDALGESVWGSLWRPLEKSLEGGLWRPIWSFLKDGVGTAVDIGLAEQLAGFDEAPRLAEVAKQRGAMLLGASGHFSLSFVTGPASDTWQLRWAFGGQHDAYWVAFYRFCEQVLDVRFNPQDTRQLGLWAELCHTGWWAPYQDWCLCAERPAVVWMEQEPGATDSGPVTYRLHCADGPALAFHDGLALYVRHGAATEAPRRR